MIKLKKLPEPDILKNNAAIWLKAIQDKLAAGQVPTDSEKSKYRHTQIKEVLKKETNGKCAYCESRLLHIAFGDVEHISPKSLKITDLFRWENLTLACDLCNTYKKDAANIADPYVDDPDELFRFLGPMIYPEPSSAKAVVTATQLRLNRSELLEHRNRRLAHISSLLLTIANTSDADVKKVLIDDLLTNEASEENEYTAFVRSFLKTVAPSIT